MDKLSTRKSKTKLTRKTVITSLIIVMLLSLSCFKTSALSYNSWNLCTSQVDGSYFYSGGTTLNPSWATAKQNAWCLSYSLSSNFNQRVVALHPEDNTISQLEYLFDNGYSSQACQYGTQWNSIRNEIQNLITDTQNICEGGGTTEQSQNLYSQIAYEQEKLNNLVTQISTNYFAVVNQNSYPDVLDTIFSEGSTIISSLWNFLGLTLKTVGTNSTDISTFFGLSFTADDMKQIADTVSVIVKTFAYALACVLFGINIIDSGLRYELMTVRGGVNIFGRILLAKVWIDLAVPISMGVLNICNSLAYQVLNQFTTSSILIPSTLVNINANTGNGLLDLVVMSIEKAINFLASILLAAPQLVIEIVLIVSICSVFIKIISRSFELTALLSLSPLFFATLTAESSRKYFMKFLSAFLSTAGYVVFVSIVYTVASKWISQCMTVSISGIGDLAMAILSMLPRALIIIACCRVMKKPPKVLTSLFEA